jgi:hypothetical protein
MPLEYEPELTYGLINNSRFHHRPVARHQPRSKLETAYHRADKAIQQIVDLLAA